MYYFSQTQFEKNSRPSLKKTKTRTTQWIQSGCQIWRLGLLTVEFECKTRKRHLEWEEIKLEFKLQG